MAEQEVVKKSALRSPVGHSYLAMKPFPDKAPQKTVTIFRNGALVACAVCAGKRKRCDACVGTQTPQRYAAVKDSVFLMDLDQATLLGPFDDELAARTYAKLKSIVEFFVAPVTKPDYSVLS